MLKKIRSLLDNLSIVKKMFIIFLVVTLFPVSVLGISLFSFSKNYILEIDKADMNNAVKSIAENVDFQFEMVLRKSDMVIQDKTIQNELSRSYKDLINVLSTFQQVNQMVIPVIDEMNYTDTTSDYYTQIPDSDLDISFFLADETPFEFSEHYQYGCSFYPLSKLKDYSWFEDFLGSATSYYISYQFSDSGSGQRLESINLLRHLYNLDSMEYIGVVSFEVKTSVIQSIFSSNGDLSKYGVALAGNDNKLLLTDKTNDLPPDTQFFFGVKGSYASNNLPETEYDIYSRPLRLVPFNLVLYTNKNASSDVIFTIAVVSVCICLVAFVLSLILMSVLTGNISSRLKKLKDKMAILHIDSSAISIDVSGKDEIGQINETLNRMVKELREYINLEYDSRLKTQFIELELLQEQIDPHLLYNSLSAIRYIAMVEECPQIAQITSDMISFYKKALSRGHLYVPIPDEIHLVSVYIELIKTIYQLDIEYSCECTEELKEAYCMKLILQPIVENAIIHGLRESGLKGQIDIQVRLQDQIIVFTVEDNGAGMDQETLHNLLHSTKEGSGFGLYNVNQRVKLLYGEMYGVEIISELGKGTQVTIKIPYTASTEEWLHRPR